MKQLALVSLSTLLWAFPAFAQWTLDNDASRLSFVSTKAGTAAEVHRFGSLEGVVDDHGNVTLGIYLDSVDTAIEIRDERMREMLFETEQYPTAELTASVDIEALEALSVGESTTMASEAELSIHGTSTRLTVSMTVARLSESRVLAISREPLIVNASQVGLLEGVERLREVAGLPSISPAVPVTFVLAFDRAVD